MVGCFQRGEKMTIDERDMEFVLSILNAETIIVKGEKNGIHG